MRTLPPSTIERIAALWDHLADARPGTGEAAREQLMRTVAELVGAQNAWWMALVRLRHRSGPDPANHWRPATVRHLHATPGDREFVRRATELIAQGAFDETMLANVRGAGTFRVNWLAEMASEAWWESRFYQLAYRDRGIADAIFACTPVSEDAEAFMGFHLRGKHGARFEPGAVAVITHALRPLRWFQRHLLLEHGLLVARSALSETERRVLRLLLTELSEAKIAIALGLARSTTHNHVTAIYRKLGVRSRAGLMALWLGWQPDGAPRTKGGEGAEPARGSAGAAAVRARSRPSRRAPRPPHR